MKTEIDFDAIIVDGARLKAAREARGMSVLDMAAAVTLSREQIQHMEDGGNRPFYTPAHKLLAVRKYSAALEIPYDEVVSGVGAYQTIPAPEDAPAGMMSAAQMPEPSPIGTNTASGSSPRAKCSKNSTQPVITPRTSSR